MKKFMLCFIILMVASLSLVACAPVEPGSDAPFSEAALVIIGAVIIAPVAQAWKVYRERGGKKPSSKVINYAIFGLAVVLVLVFNGFGYFQGVDLPAINWDEPAEAFQVVAAYLGEYIALAGSFLGVCVLAYGILKSLLFQRIPGLMTANMIKASKAKG